MWGTGGKEKKIRSRKKGRNTLPIAYTRPSDPSVTHGLAACIRMRVTVTARRGDCITRTKRVLYNFAREISVSLCGRVDGVSSSTEFDRSAFRSYKSTHGIIAVCRVHKKETKRKKGERLKRYFFLALSNSTSAFAEPDRLKFDSKRVKISRYRFIKTTSLRRISCILDHWTDRFRDVKICGGNLSSRIERNRNESAKR